MKSVQIKRNTALLLAALTSGVACPGLAQEASVDGKAEVLACAKSFEQAQILRNQAQYLAAMQEALKCSQPKCGQALFTECSKLYTQFQEATPSVVLSASDKKGNDVLEARVLIDGTTTVSELDGRPVNLDPGNHEFQFSAPGMTDLVRHITLLAGEKFRPISVRFSAVPTTTSSKSPADAEPASKPPQPTLGPRRIPVVSYVLGGVSVLAAGTFIAYRVSGSNRFDELMQSCSPRCSDVSVDNLKQRYTISYTALGVSAAALAGAFGFYFFQPRTAIGSDTALFVSPAPQGASAQLSTRF